MASSMSERDKLNPALWLAIPSRQGHAILSVWNCPLCLTRILCPCIKFSIYQTCLVKWLDIGVILLLDHKLRKHVLGLSTSSHLDFMHGQYAIFLLLFWLAKTWTITSQNLPPTITKVMRSLDILIFLGPLKIRASFILVYLPLLTIEG